MATRKKERAAKTYHSLKDLVPLIDSHKLSIASDAKAIVRAELKPLFDDHPEIDGIRWSQVSTFGAGETDNIVPELFIDDVEYKMGSSVSERSVPYNDPHLFDAGFDRHSTDWICPWNDRRIEDANLLDSMTKLEEKLFDAQNSLATAFGDNRVTVTRHDVLVEPIP